MHGATMKTGHKVNNWYDLKKKKSFPVLLSCYKTLSMCYAMKTEAFIGQFLINFFFFHKFIFNSRHAMMAPGATVHTSFAEWKFVFVFYQINCLIENIFPSV